MKSVLDDRDRALTLISVTGIGVLLAGTALVAVGTGTVVGGIGMLTSLFGLGLFGVAGLWFTARFIRRLISGNQSA